MSTFERFQRLMVELDPGRQRSLLDAAKTLRDEMNRRVDGTSEAQWRESDRWLARGLERLMDLIEADSYLAAEFGSACPEEGEELRNKDMPERLLDELERWAKWSRRSRPSRLPPGIIGSKTVTRMDGLMPMLGAWEQDDLFDAASRLTRGWRGGWAELEPWERTIGVWRILAGLNEQMDAMERLLAHLDGSDTMVDPVERPQARAAHGAEMSKSMGSGEVTRDQAFIIAGDARRRGDRELPERCAQPTKVTEEAPDGIYRTWEDEPAWYVWFLPNTFGLASSDVIVVSKRTGQVIGSGSAGDEG